MVMTAIVGDQPWLVVMAVAIPLVARIAVVTLGTMLGGF